MTGTPERTQSVPLYLASTSPARLALLRQAGIEPLLVAPEVDEAAAVAEAEQALGQTLDAASTAQLLARLKARAGAEALPPRAQGLVVGGDSVFAFEGAVHGKPHTAQRARERWLAQSGSCGVLHSAHWVIDLRDRSVPVADAPAQGEVRSALVEFAELDAEEIEAYVASGEPLLVAGAFTVDSLGGPFIRRVVGDPSTVVGLSLSGLRDSVRALGVPWTSLWNRAGHQP